MSKWFIENCDKKANPKQPVLIEGLPGIGNVGKVAVDFLIDELGAKKIYEIFSYNFPHSVFVREDNLVDLPKIEIYYKQRDGDLPDLLLLAGDVQPVDEESSYTFCEKILDILRTYKGSEIVTLGGIGLPDTPKDPKVFCTGNSAKIVKKYSSKNVNNKLHGVVGPIMGVSGSLVVLI